MDIKQLKEIIELFERSQLSEIEIEENKNRIILKKSEILPHNVLVHSQLTEQLSEQEATVCAKENIIKSPLVGIFYSSNNEGKEPLIKVGDNIKSGDLLCVIEAMKTMNEIRSDMSGVVKEILVANGAAVEYQQPLFVIEKND